jgi:hypothetical protein
MRICHRRKTKINKKGNPDMLTIKEIASIFHKLRRHVCPNQTTFSKISDFESKSHKNKIWVL